MDPLHIELYTRNKQVFDEKRGHLMLNGDLEYSVRIKEYEEEYSKISSLLGKERIEKEKEFNKKFDKNNIRWMYLLVNTGVILGNEELDFNPNGANYPKKVRFPPLLCGGGMLWLEPYIANLTSPVGKVPNGCYISSTGIPQIIKIVWTDGNNIEIKGPVKFGSQVRLHIYTTNLYGQELEVTVTDRDYMDPNDTLLVTNNNQDASVSNPIIVSTVFRTEIGTRLEQPFEKEFDNLIRGNVNMFGTKQTHIQKTTMNVFIDPYWAITAGESLDIFPVIVLESNRKKLKLEDRNYLKIKEKGEKYIDPYENGNKAVNVGNIETNISAFSPCRYVNITGNYEGAEPNTLFDETNQIKTNSKYINVGVVSFSENKKKYELSVRDINTEGCSNDENEKHENNIISTKYLDLIPVEYKHTKGVIEKISFIPLFPYKHLNNGKPNFFDFFLEYLPTPLANFKGLPIPIPIETCAYQKQVNLIVFPDALYSIHLFYGNVIGKKKVFYKGLKLDMVKGLKDDFDKANHYRNEITNIVKYIMPNAILQDFIMDVIMCYLQEEAEKFSVGLHINHSFKTDKDYDTLDFGKEYPIIPKLIIAAGMICSVALDVLVIYLSGGGSLAAKTAAKTAAKSKSFFSKSIDGAKKANLIRKRYKTAKKIATFNFDVKAEPDFSGVEFIAPAIARSTGQGYVQNVDNRDEKEKENDKSNKEYDGAVSYEITERIVASPLLALKYGIKYDLADVVSVLTGVTAIFNSLEVTNNIIGEVLAVKSLKDGVSKFNKDQKQKKIDKHNEKSGVIIIGTPEEEEEKSVAVEASKKTLNRQSFLDNIEKSIKKNIKDFLSSIGAEGDFELYFSGYIDANYEFRVRGDQGLQLDIYDADGNKQSYNNSTGVTYGSEYGIVAAVKFSFSSNTIIYWSKINDYTPWFLKTNFSDTTQNIELGGELGGSIFYERTFVRNGSGATMKTENIIFTGIRGSLFVKIKIKTDEDKEIWGVEKGKKPPKEASATEPDKFEEHYTTLLEGFTIPFEPSPVFDDSLNKYFTK